VADKKISELVELTSSVSVTDALAIADASASQTKKINPKTLLEQAFKIIDDGSIPGDKVDSGDLPAGSVDTVEIADRAVTADKLDDNSSGLVSAVLPAGTRIGQVGIDTTNNKFYVWSGSQWILAKGAGSVNEIVSDTTPGLLINTLATQTDDSVLVTAYHVPTTAAGQFLAGPTGSAGPIAQRVIIGADLPTASPTEKGAAQVNGNGLIVEGDVLKIDNTVSPTNGLFEICDVDGNGLVVNHRAIQGDDVPIANDSTLGVVRPGVDLAVDGQGNMNHITKNNAPGTYTKFTVDLTGHVIAGTNLTADDIPVVNGSSITGNINSDANILDRSIGEIKLADYSTCLVQEGAPSGDYKLGQLWFTPSTSQLRVYGRGSSGDLWLSVGFGALQAQTLRWAGTVNADTSTIMTLTDIGVSEGLTAGGPIPTPSDELSGLYFVVQTGGSSITIPNVNGDTCTEGDWILYIDQAQGAIHLDISAGGGGGGGGASKLDDLTDVDLSVVEADQLLQYDAISGMWKNVSLISGGTF
jgi:hypothetical protein